MCLMCGVDIHKNCFLCRVVIVSEGILGIMPYCKKRKKKYLTVSKIALYDRKSAFQLNWPTEVALLGNDD